MQLPAKRMARLLWLPILALAVNYPKGFVIEVRYLSFQVWIKRGLNLALG